MFVERTFANYLLFPLALWLSFAVLFSLIIWVMNSVKSNTLKNPVREEGSSFVLQIAFVLSLLSTIGALVASVKNTELLLTLIATVVLLVLTSVQLFEKFQGSYKATLPRIPMLLWLLGIINVSVIYYIQDITNLKNIRLVEQNLQPSADVLDVALQDYEGDYILAYNSAQRYASGDMTYFKSKLLHIYNVTDRTPFFYFIFIPILKVFDWSIFSYQILVGTMSYLFLIPLYYLARMYLSSILLASAVTAFGAFSHFFLFTTIFGPNKTLALFFILSALYYFLMNLDNPTKNTKYLPVAGLMFAYAYFSHQFSLLYLIGCVLLILAITNRHFFSASNIGRVLLITYPTAIAVTIWLIFTASVNINNQIYTNVVFSHDWAVSGRNIANNKAPTLGTMADVVISRNYWNDKLYNFLGYFIFNPKPKTESRLFDYSKITLIGSLGWILSVSLVVGTSRGFCKNNKNLLLLSLIILILPVLYNGFYIRMGLMWYALGIVPILYILSVRAIMQAGVNQTRLLILTGFIIANYVYLSFTDPRHKINLRIAEYGQTDVTIYLNLFITVAVYALLLTIVFVLSKKEDAINATNTR